MDWRRRSLAALAVLTACAAFASAPLAASLPPPSLPSAFEDPDDVPLPDRDLWQRIRMGFTLEALDSPLVAEQEQWYASRPEYIKRFVDRGSRYLHYIVEQVEKRGMPAEIALLPVIESAFVPKAFSHAKAAGLWQFIPSTGKNYGLTQDWWRDNRRDVVAATDAALSYLQKLHETFGTWELALAAYNCGEGCVSRAIAANQRRRLATDYASLKLPSETQAYVPKLIAVKNIVLSPPSYGIDLDSIPDEPYFMAVKAPQRIDVKVAAKLAGMSEEEFIALNPAHNKPVAVAQAGMLFLPIDRAREFESNLESYDQPLVSWTTYPARKGESLDAIARKHGATLAQLKAANDALKLDKRARLRAAAPVLVPIGTGKKIVATALRTASVAASGHAYVAPSTTHYVVKRGDTLYGIAQRHATSVEALRRLNDLPGSDLQPGMRLRVS